MHFFFAYYPYICITLLLAGLAFRYVTDPGDWNARSSEIFEKTWLRRGSIIFHYAIILSFFGHIVGLLTPDSVMHALRISMEAHTVVAVGMGMILAPLVVVGLGILLWRRTTNEHVWATTVPMDVLVVVLILINGCTGFLSGVCGAFSGICDRWTVAEEPCRLPARCGSDGNGAAVPANPCGERVYVVRADSVQQIGAHLQRAGHIRAASVPDLSEAVCRTLRTLSAGVF